MATKSDATTQQNLTARIVNIGVQLSRQDPKRAAAMMAAVGVHFRVIDWMLSEPTHSRRERHDATLPPSSVAREAVHSLAG